MNNKYQEQLVTDVEMLQVKINALSHQAYDRLESVETSLDTTWAKKNILALNYLKEQQQDLYILATVISDIRKDVERLVEETQKADNIEPDQEKMLPTSNKQ